jgi:hypothetical protein
MKLNSSLDELPAMIISGLPQLMVRAILSLMTRFPKPRGFWDYALFALAVTGGLVVLFSLEASDRVGWADAALASAIAVLSVLVIVLGRRREKARWIAQPTRCVYLVAIFGALVLMFGGAYVDTYFLHRKDITSNQLCRDAAIAIAVAAGSVWPLLRRRRSKRQLS